MSAVGFIFEEHNEQGVRMTTAINTERLLSPDSRAGNTTQQGPDTGRIAIHGSAHRRIGESDLRVFPLAISGNVFGWTEIGRAHV